MSEEKKIFIDNLLENYEKYAESCRINHKYSIEDSIPRTIIQLYYAEMEHLDHEIIADNYRRKYLQNENILENVKNPEEQAGLEVVIDYIFGNEWKHLKNNITAMILRIHQLLFSKVPHPEHYAGNFKTATNVITYSDTKTSEVSNVSEDVDEQNKKFNELINKKEFIENSKKESDLFEYINESIELSCRLLEIHPFDNGNGRTVRALLNILFRNIGLPPVYVTPEEKAEYRNAVDIAVRDKNYSYINQFYYYKICDSIVELDLKEKDDALNRT